MWVGLQLWSVPHCLVAVKVEHIAATVAVCASTMLSMHSILPSLQHPMSPPVGVCPPLCVLQYRVMGRGHSAVWERYIQRRGMLFAGWGGGGGGGGGE